MRYRTLPLAVALALGAAGCGNLGWVGNSPTGPRSNTVELTPVSLTYRDLLKLPKPKGKISAAVYNFRDQTGQYKPQPDSTFSTAVSQGGASMLVKALLDSQWFAPIEREGLQDLLTERKIVRATLDDKNPMVPPANLTPDMQPAQILLEGGIVAYEQNVQTGGEGARYLGVGASELYRVDQVTVNLRAVDVRNGKILNSVLVTKTILSRQLDTGVFKFIEFKSLLEAELGFSRNEPAQLALYNAIQSAVLHLVVQGLRDNNWALENPEEMNSPIIQAYLSEADRQLTQFSKEPMPSAVE